MALMSSRLLILLCAFAFVAQAFALPTPEEPIIVRSKRQQCRCVKNPNGGLTCSCAKGPAGSSAGLGAQHDVPQSTDIANQLTAMQSPQAGQARCGCIQIVFQGTPQYNCQCGDQNGNSLPTTTTMTPMTTTTTTTQAPTTTTTVEAQAPTTQSTQASGACNCIMISISSPQTAQYQCQCENQQNETQTGIPGPLPSTTPTSTMVTASPPTVYPAIGQVATTQEACYCLDPQYNTLSNYCGCRCDCMTLTVSAPNAYCGCPQAAAQAYPMETYDYTQVFSSSTTPPTTTTAASTTSTTTTTTTTPSPMIAQQADASSATQYPLTTTCVMYVNVPTTACSCLPQYDQCAQNVCCLKAKYRSYKKNEEPTSSSTIDMLMNVLKTIKTKLE